MTALPKVTLVVPVLNEEACIVPFVQAVREKLGDVADWRILFVDDDSRDGTPGIIRSLSAEDSRIRGLFLTRRFGHQISLVAGLDHAEGDAVVTMDVDLEHPPEVVRELIARWREGHEVVTAVKETLRGRGLGRRAGTWLLYAILGRISSAPPAAFGADFRLLDRAVVRSLRRFEERNRFLRGLVAWVGYRQAIVPYAPGRRTSGRTKFNFRRLLKIALDGMLGFSFVPLRLVALGGLATAALAFCLGIFYLLDTIIRGVVFPGWASLFVATTFFAGVQMLLIGVLGEYIARIYDEVKRRPLYLVRETPGLEPPPASEEGGDPCRPSR